MSKIPFFSLGEQHKALHGQISNRFDDIFKKGHFILGNEVRLFEDEFASYCGAKYAVGTGSGTEALHLSLLASGVGKGDEVVTVPNTYIATALAISYAGAKPLFVDTMADTHTIDCDALETLVRKRKRPPKAVIPVHLYGCPADMQRILKIAGEYNMKVIEDACQAHGAMYHHRKVGTFGDTGCFSFYPTKNLGALGDGGIVVTTSRMIHDKLLLLRNYGQKKRYFHQVRGFNSRLDELQAGVLRIKLPNLNKWNDLRRERAHLYSRLLKNTPLMLPRETEKIGHVYHLYVIRSKYRNRLQKFLADRGIETLIHYPVPIHLQKAYKDLGYVKGSFPVAEKAATEILSLPLYAEITSKQIEKVCEAIVMFCGSQ